MHSALGQSLGWLMAVIYMGGRLPQIWLNVNSQLFLLRPSILHFFCSSILFFCALITDKVVDYVITGQIKRGSVEVIFDLYHFSFRIITH